jgi:hypothetical protein
VNERTTRRRLHHGRIGFVIAFPALMGCHGETAMERGRSLDRAAAAEAAEQTLEDLQEQGQRDLAIAAIENDRGDPPRRLDGDELEGVLAYYCSDCHGMSRNPDAIGPGPIFESLEDLLANGKVVPGDASASRVMVRLLRGEMPPPESGLPEVPPATIGLVADFIDELPAAL